MTQAKTGRVLGVGGVFFRSTNSGKTGEWYAKYLGIKVESWGATCGASFPPADMPKNGFTVWSAFPQDTEYFGDSGQEFMINLVVDDLDAALANAAAGGARVLPEREDQDFGRFGWFVDPDGNRVELWQPPDKADT